MSKEGAIIFMLNGGSVVVFPWSISGGIEGHSAALMYKMRERERDQGNVHKLMAFLCVSTMSEQEAVQLLSSKTSKFLVF